MAHFNRPVKQDINLVFVNDLNGVATIHKDGCNHSLRKRGRTYPFAEEKPFTFNYAESAPFSDDWYEVAPCAADGKKATICNGDDCGFCAGRY